MYIYSIPYSLLSNMILYHKAAYDVFCYYNISIPVVVRPAVEGLRVWATQLLKGLGFRITCFQMPRGLFEFLRHL